MSYYDTSLLHPLAAENSLLRRTLAALIPMVTETPANAAALVTARILAGMPTTKVEGETQEDRLARKRREFDADDGA